MNTLYVIEPGKLELRDIEKPEPDKGRVLLRAGAVGFCGSDLTAFRGTSAMQYYPAIIGHEIGAKIEKVGENVAADITAGMDVTVSPYQSCGACVPCRRGRPNACRENRTMGVRRDGAMTEYIVAPAADIYHSDRLSLKELALVEPLSVGFNAVERGRVRAGDKVATRN